MHFAQVQNQQPSAVQKESSFLFKTIIDALPCPVYYKSRDGIFLGYNTAFSDQILGNPENSLIGTPLHDIEMPIPEDHLMVYQAKDAELLLHGDSQVFDAPVLCGDGVSRQFAFHRSVIRLPENEATIIVGLMVDITATKKAECELADYRTRLEDMVAKRSVELLETNQRLSKEIEERRRAEEKMVVNEERYRRIFENTGTATILIEPDNTISMANARVENLVKLPRDQFVGTTKFKDFIEPSHHQRIELYHELRIQGDQEVPRQYEFQMIDAKGKIRDILANVQWLPETRQTISSMVDITESNKLQKERQRLAAVIEQSDEAVLITDNHGNVEYVNPAFEKLSGFSRNECVGQTMDAPFLCNQDRQIFNQMTFMVSQDDSWSGRLENHRQDGQSYIADTRIFPICDDKGKAVNLVCIKTDVTHEVLLERQLQHAQKMEAIGTLAGGIAHDFNNILGGIQGYTEISMMKATDNDLRRNLARILDGCQRAKELVQNILAFSRKNDEETKPIEIQVIAKEALKLLRASIPSTIEFKQHITSKPSIVNATPTQIHQVIMNLCTNAAHAMQKNGGTIDIKLENTELTAYQCQGKPSLAPGPYSVLTVKDTGEGIDPGNLDRIFEPYFTTKEQTGGTGLGLSMVHGIINSFGGSIMVSSQMGIGTIFTVYLPRVGDSSETAEPAQNGLQRGTERILVADDELFILEIMTDMLTSLGYAVETANGGLNAWEQFSKSPDHFDMVIADLTMPKITGRQLAEKIRQKRNDIPIILTTGMNFDTESQKEEFNAFAAVLNKPLLYGELARTVRQVLDNAKKNGQLIAPIA